MEHESDMCFNADCFKDECDANIVEAIFDEASQKLHDMLKADVQETIDQYKTAKKEQAVLEKDIAILKSQKRYLEQQVGEAFKKAEDVPEKVYDYGLNDSFDRWIGSADVHKYYFGDQMEPERMV